MKRTFLVILAISLVLGTSPSSLAFDASDAVGPSYRLQLMSPNTFISPNWFGERKLVDPTNPVVFKLTTKDDKNWVRLSSMTNWIIAVSYTRKKNANIPPACPNPPAVKSQANVFENLTARTSLASGEKAQEFIIMALIPPLPLLSSGLTGCDQYLEPNQVGAVIGPTSNYQVGSWINSPSAIGIVLIGNITDEAGRTQTSEQTVDQTNSPYFELNMDPKSFKSKVWATGVTYTLPDQGKLNFTRYSEIKERINSLTGALEILKGQSKTTQSDLSEIDAKLMRAKNVITSINNEMSFQTFYIEPTSDKALKLPVVNRGEVVEEVDFDSLNSFLSDLELLKSRVTLQNTSKPSPSVSPNSISSPKLFVISCVKGKTLKKVTGTNPKCPAGYKQTAKVVLSSN